ncbi:MAG TPA: hypothetical protein VFL54_06785 [Gammaproteobacteria bacterium]|nr:hypothetical protein [Gammaproteobacteria bacterium]
MNGPHPFDYPPERPIKEPINDMREAAANLRAMVGAWDAERWPTPGQMATADIMLAGMHQLIVEIRQRTWGCDDESA